MRSNSGVGWGSTHLKAIDPLFSEAESLNIHTVPAGFAESGIDPRVSLEGRLTSDSTITHDSYTFLIHAVHRNTHLVMSFNHTRDANRQQWSSIMFITWRLHHNKSEIAHVRVDLYSLAIICVSHQITPEDMVLNWLRMRLVSLDIGTIVPLLC